MRPTASVKTHVKNKATRRPIDTHAYIEGLLDYDRNELRFPHSSAHQHTVYKALELVQGFVDKTETPEEKQQSPSVWIGADGMDSKNQHLTVERTANMML